MGPHPRPDDGTVRRNKPVPYTEAGGWRDDVVFMQSVMARLEGRVPGIRWVKPAAIDDNHLLLWAGGEHQERNVGAMADWADERWPPDTDKAAAKLTRRELEIALLATKGMRAVDIARLLYISVRTVHSHLHKIYAKTGVANRVQLLQWLTGQFDGTVQADPPDSGAAAPTCEGTYNHPAQGRLSLGG